MFAKRLKTLANRLLVKRLVGETSINRYKGGTLTLALTLLLTVTKDLAFFAWLLIGGLPGFYLGFIVWGRSPEWPKATRFLAGSGGMLPWKFFWNECALRCNLVHFETQFWEMLLCALTSTRLDDFFWYSYLYTVRITIFFGGEASAPQIPCPIKFGLLNIYLEWQVVPQFSHWRNKTKQTKHAKWERETRAVLRISIWG